MCGLKQASITRKKNTRIHTYVHTCIRNTIKYMDVEYVYSYFIAYVDKCIQNMYIRPVCMSMCSELDMAGGV